MAKEAHEFHFKKYAVAVAMLESLHRNELKTP